MVPNFMAIGRTIAELSRFKSFQYGGRLPSWIFKFTILAAHVVWRVSMRHHAKLSPTRQTVHGKIWPILNFSDGDRPLSWIF